MPCLQITWRFICFLINVRKQILPRCPGITGLWGSRWGGREEVGSWDRRKCNCLQLHTSAMTYSLLSLSISLMNFVLQWVSQCWVKGHKTCYFLQNTEEALLEEVCRHETIFSGHCRNDLIELFMAVVNSLSISHEKSKFTSNHNNLSFSCWAEEWVLNVNMGPGFLQALPNSGCHWADDKVCCLVQHYKIQYFCWSQPSLLNPGHFQNDNRSRN